MNNKKHPDLIRISILIFHLQNLISDQLENPNLTRKNQEILSNVKDQINNSGFLHSNNSLPSNYNSKQSIYKEKSAKNPFSNQKNLYEIGEMSENNSPNFRKKLDFEDENEKYDSENLCKN